MGTQGDSSVEARGAAPLGKVFTVESKLIIEYD